MGFFQDGFGDRRRGNDGDVVVGGCAWEGGEAGDAGERFNGGFFWVYRRHGWVTVFLVPVRMIVEKGVRAWEVS